VTDKVSRAPGTLRLMDIHLSSPVLDFEVDVRLSTRGSSWVAVAVIDGERQIGLGRSAREALAASLSSLGRERAAALLADPSLFGASMQLREGRMIPA